MMGSGAEPGPGPAPPPSLTLPPLRELDKAIRPESSSSSHRGSTGMGLMNGPGGQSRPQFTDPHLHQHSSHPHSQQSVQQHQLQQQQQRGSHSFPQQQQQHQQQHGPSSHNAGPQQYYPHDNHSRHSSSVGSLPDLYMSSSSAPSTTTTSSLSRADSLSSIEYLHGSHPLHHSHAHRHLSSSASTTTGSTTGSSFGHSVASGSVSSGGSSSLYHHHTAGLGRANLNAAIHHQRNPRDSAASSTTGSLSNALRTGASGQGGDTTSSNGQQGNTNGKSGSTASGSVGTEQGRNSTKRAAQNRAAQRAFRQRKDLYVRELERKAELLQQAEGQIMRLTARNRELEVALASNHPSSSSSLSPQQSPLHSHASPTTGLVVAAGPSSTGPASEQDQQQQHQQPHHTLHHSLSREQLDRSERERGSEWSRGGGERPPTIPDRDREFYDDSSSNHSGGHSYPSSLPRATLGRRSASQPMRSAYNASSSPLTNDSLKNHALKQQLATNQHTHHSHPQPGHPQYQHHHSSRTESDYEHEGHDPNPHRHLHRHPSVPMLNQNRRGSNSADSGDDYGTAVQHQHHHYDSSRNQGLPRRGSVDSRMELTSPVFHHQSTSHRSNSSSNAGSRLLPSEYPDSASPPSSAQPYTSSNGNNGNLQQQRPLHERPPLYPIMTQGGPRSGTLGSARSWSAQQEDGMKPHSPMMSSPVSGLPRGGGMAASATSPTRGGNGYGPSRAAEMEYISDERSETGSGYDAVQKRPSDGAISWTGSNSSSSRGGLESQSSPHAYHNSTGGLGLRKESSWSSFSMAGKGNGGDSSAVSLPPVSALAGGQHDIGDDMEMQDSHHHPRPSQHLQQQREGDRQSSGSENNGAGSNHHRGSIAMISDSPEMISSESRLHNTNSGSVMTPQMPGRQPYFSSQHQQLHSSPFSQPQQQHQQHVHAQHHPNHRGGHHPMSPGNEYPPSLSTGGRGGGAGSEMDGVYEQPRYTGTIIPTGYHEETMMRSP